MPCSRVPPDLRCRPASLRADDRASRRRSTSWTHSMRLPSWPVHPRARVAGCAAAALLIAAGALWATGGLDPADTPARVAPGKEVDQHLFRTKLVGAHVTTIKKFGQTMRVLVINAWVTNPT